MEETKNSQPKPSSQTLIHECVINPHENHKCNHILDSRSVTECLNAAKSLFNSNQETYEHFKTSLDEEFKMHSEILANIDEKFVQLTDNHNPHELCLIMEEIKQFQQKFAESSLFTEFTKLKINIKLATDKNLHRSSDGNKLINCSDRESSITEEQSFGKSNQFGKKTIRPTKNSSNRNQQSKNQEEQKIEKLFSNQNNSEIGMSRLKVKDSKSKLDCNASNTKTVRESIIQNEKNIREQEYAIQSIVFTRMYERRTNRKISDVHNFDLKISLSDAKQKNLFKDIKTTNLRLPNLKRIKIDNVSDSNMDLSRFLANCTPHQLKFLIINNATFACTPIKSKISINSLLKAVAAVAKVVYIRLYEFSETDLQQFFRAACNVKRIIIHRCSVHCSSALDFGANLKYNTSSLCFQCCGYTYFKELTTDWKTDPSCFSHIVDAIGNSGLRHSLTKLSIGSNPTLDKAKVQELLNAKGMEHISVVLEEPSLSSE